MAVLLYLELVIYVKILLKNINLVSRHTIFLDYLRKLKVCLPYFWRNLIVGGVILHKF
jgi:hypothetical protein